MPNPFNQLTATAAPIMRGNIDTDVIIRIERLVGNSVRGTLGKWAFGALRYLPDGSDNPEFILNREPYRQAEILVTGPNFGCGSSREGAAYAFHDAGFRAIVAPSFGDIFFNNCLKNGIVPARLPAAACDELRRRLVEAPGTELAVDLDAQLVDGRHAFAVDAFFREMLLNGVDEIGLTLSMLPEIEAFERTYREHAP
jgi:3-isopropylmalate/(R)-2-methylmalate dehydratase small subunit